MVLQRLYPFNELRQAHNRLWRSVDIARVNGENGTSRWAVPLDVIQDGDNIVVRASMPGVKADDISVTIENEVLTIKGKTESEGEVKDGNYLMRERRSGTFHRALRLPDTIDVDNADTSYENGVVSIIFPKVESKKAKRLELKVG
ncbi:MAG: Hsp20/alpha crystallin family protein [Chloroflexi bacterium]|nr:Hsp20/alpha crystallin family protein [Chloroflexota bacterium]